HKPHLKPGQRQSLPRPEPYKLNKAPTIVRRKSSKQKSGSATALRHRKSGARLAKWKSGWAANRSLIRYHCSVSRVPLYPPFQTWRRAIRRWDFDRGRAWITAQRTPAAVVRKPGVLPAASGLQDPKRNRPGSI